MTESNQGPATPGTAARCETCGLPIGPQWTTEGYKRPHEDDPRHWRLGYERLKAENASLHEQIAKMDTARSLAVSAFDGAAHENASLLESLQAARACIEFDPPSDAEQIIARLRLIVENHNKQCGDFVVQRNSAWRRLVEIGKAKAAAEQRAEAAEREMDEQRKRADMNGDLSSQWHDKWAAAEQRNTELEGALRPAIGLSERLVREHGASAKENQAPRCGCAMCETARDLIILGKQLLKYRAALHDEERRPQPEAPEPLEPRFDLTHAETFEDARREFGLHDEERSEPPQEFPDGWAERMKRAKAAEEDTHDD